MARALPRSPLYSAGAEHREAPGLVRAALELDAAALDRLDTEGKCIRGVHVKGDKDGDGLGLVRKHAAH